MNKLLTCRDALPATALLGVTSLLNAPEALATVAPPAAAKTPALSLVDLAAIKAALGKKGTYVEAQATHTAPLPRNNLKVSIKGKPVPISFGFGGWVAIKHPLDVRWSS